MTKTDVKKNTDKVHALQGFSGGINNFYNNEEVKQ